MRRWLNRAVWIAGATLVGASATLVSAQNQQSPPPAPQNAPQSTTPAKPGAGAKGQSGSAADSGSNAAPAPADDNAFPEAQSEAAQQKADAAQPQSNDFPQAQSQAAQQKADAASGAGTAPSAAGDEPYSSSASRDKGLDLLGTRDSAISDGAGHFVNNPALVKEDIRVGKFYLDQGNYSGAYMRLKEATQVGPGNVEAVYLLAQAARKSSHLDEAESNYKLYLQVDPKGKWAKDAKKALAELSGK